MKAGYDRGLNHPCVEIVLDAPDKIGRPNGICIDQCLVEEIKELWDKGVVTHGCCCGHDGEYPSWIGVADESIELMNELGYKNTVNPNFPESESFFHPKTYMVCERLFNEVFTEEMGA